MTDHLLAAVVDHLASANWMFASVNSEEGDKPNPPAPVPRPSYDSDTDTGGGEARGGSEPKKRKKKEGPERPEEAAGPEGVAADAAPSTVQLARFFG